MRRLSRATKRLFRCCVSRKAPQKGPVMQAPPATYVGHVFRLHFWERNAYGAP